MDELVNHPANAATTTAPVRLYEEMLLIRQFEQATSELVQANEIPGLVHDSRGQEAVAVGTCFGLRTTDIVTSTHRAHGHALAKGVDPRALMAELMGLESGTNHGRGGSQHVMDLSCGFYGANGMVGGGVPYALGAAWANQQEGSDDVAVALFGEGAVAQGVVLECLNLAALWRLPVIFVCEDNGYAVTLPKSRGIAGELLARASSCEIPARRVDGMDVTAVHDAMAAAVEQTRNGAGPIFLHCTTYRYFGHHSGEAVLKLRYRTSEEVASWKKLDPLAEWRWKLPDAERVRIESGISRRLTEVVCAVREEAEAARTGDASRYMYADPRHRVRGVVN